MYSVYNYINERNFVFFPFESIINKYNKISKFILYFFIPYYELENNLKSLVGRAINGEIIKEDLELIHKGFIKGQNLFGNKLLKNLALLSFERIEDVLLDALDYFPSRSIPASLEHFLDCLDEKSLEEILSLDKSKMDLTKRTQEFVKNNENQSPFFTSTLRKSKELTYETIYFLEEMLNIMLDMSGVSEFVGRELNDHESSSKYQNQEKWRTLGILWSYPVAIFGSLLIKTKSPVLSYILTTIISAGTLGLIVTYKRHYSPCPKHFNRSENLTKNFLENGNEESFIRENILGRIFDLFNAGFGVMLVAEPGVGKSSLMDSLPQYLQQEFPTSPSKATQVFKVNGGEVNGNYNGVDLNNLANRFARHREQVIFSLDEAHSLFEKTLMGQQSNLLLTFQDKFKKTICATTTAQFEKTIKEEKAFNRRFVRIDLEPLVEYELKAVLLDCLKKNAPYLCIDDNDDILKYIIEKSVEAFPNTSVVDASVSLLKLAIHQSKAPNFRELKDEKFKCRTLVETFIRTSLSKELVKGSQEELEIAEKSQARLNEINEILKQNEQTLAKINSLEKKCYQLKRLGNGIDKSSEKWLRIQAEIYLLNRFIAMKREKMSLPPSLNKELIDRIVGDQTERD